MAILDTPKASKGIDFSAINALLVKAAEKKFKTVMCPCCTYIITGSMCKKCGYRIGEASIE